MPGFLEFPLHGNVFPVYGRPVASEKFASGIEGEGDVLVRVEALNIAKAEAVAAWDLHSVGKARVGRFNERSVLMCGAELVIPNFQKTKRRWYAGGPEVSYVYPVLPKVSWSISNLFSPLLRCAADASSAALAAYPTSFEYSSSSCS